ncbi:MAG: N-acetylmuramoyl-L-alanine amidase [Dokdonella sp.]|uniref:N-acetylmuramoyl-L-alanine amidase n=1 Tax=Dokdonella sp. TaxID=2291710 RepID=UPI0025BCAA44|nr:N-acetylmuramoyl-L-alanine amidase [Dokdonella sp.]MBZ0222546.1 N-acetylmuramoyl-L-alanine amidase [Dokdonella sp.]MCC7256134.1 N-acetylmuramoyl-L-alanine amidase [Dokdonella sp.]
MPALAIIDWPLPYESRLAARPSSAIDLVVIHCTELPDMKMAREFGERVRYESSQTGNSGHYYIDTDGKVFRFVTDTRVAHHTFGYNPRSLGIELSNIGRYPHWGDSRHQAFTTPYTAAQIEALRALLAQLRQEHANLRWIAGHEDLDRRLEPASDDSSIQLRRRQDPGPLFPWPEVLEGSGLERFEPPAS